MEMIFVKFLSLKNCYIIYYRYQLSCSFFIHINGFKFNDDGTIQRALKAQARPFFFLMFILVFENPFLLEK